MAENVRTKINAAIKRASATARKNANKLDREALDELTQLYREAAYNLSDIIAESAGSDGLLQIENMTELLNQVNQRLAVLSETRNALLTEKMSATALLAVQPFAEDMITLQSSLNQVAHDAVLQARSFVANDGLQLSDRLWRVDNQATKDVSDAIQLAIVQGNSATQAAQDFISSGRPIPADINRKRQVADAVRVGRGAAAALVSNDGNAYRNALRVFRTEINRAHGLAYQSAAFEHPDVIGTRFLLSPQHPEVDICDMHARVNRYGLGAGVYPKGKSPWPAHPNTLSYEEVVFKDEVTGNDKEGKTDRISYLQSLNPARQNAILGRNKGWMLREGYLTENAINTPWSILKAKLEKQGVTLPSFRVEGPLIESAPAAGRTAPVSAAFSITEFKQTAGHVLDTIDGVHSDGALPVIPLKRTTTKESKSTYGMYRRTLPEYGDDAISISLNRRSPHKELTLTHEIGHFIDHKGLPGAGMSSEYHPALDKWRKAVLASPEIQWLQTLDNSSDTVAIEGKSVSVPKNYVSYLLRKREIWARSYAQWIAKRSGDQVMLEQLSVDVSKTKDMALPLPGQWDDEHFEPIAEAIEDLFKQMGWL